MSNKVNGYYLPVHRSLINKSLMCGVPREFFILNAGLGCVMVFNFHVWFFGFISLGLYLAAIPLSKTDPGFFDCGLRHVKSRHYYDC